MGLLRMRAAISCPAQTEQRRFFWWGHDTVGNKPFNYILSIMKQMGLLRMRAAISCPVQTEPVFLNVYGAQESIPRNEFRQHM